MRLGNFDHFSCHQIASRRYEISTFPWGRAPRPQATHMSKTLFTILNKAFFFINVPLVHVFRKNLMHSDFDKLSPATIMIVVKIIYIGDQEP